MLDKGTAYDNLVFVCGLDTVCCEYVVWLIYCNSKFTHGLTAHAKDTLDKSGRCLHDHALFFHDLRDGAVYICMDLNGFWWFSQEDLSRYRGYTFNCTSDG